MYGGVAVVLLAILLWGFSRFYALDLVRYPLWIGLGAFTVFLGALVLRRVRSRRHNSAYADELDRGGE